MSQTKKAIVDDQKTSWGAFIPGVDVSLINIWHKKTVSHLRNIGIDYKFYIPTKPIKLFCGKAII